MDNNSLFKKLWSKERRVQEQAGSFIPWQISYRDDSSARKSEIMNNLDSYYKTKSFIPEQISYRDDSSARKVEILNNLWEYYKNNPELFADEKTFKDAFEYWKRSQQQKALLDAFFNKIAK